MRKLPTQTILHDLLDYDPLTGVFRWARARPGHAVGSIAGGVRKNGYILIGICGMGQFMAHRLAWIYVHGLTIGGAEIDHADTNPSNNAIANLRLATSSEQKQNKKVQSNNRSGLKGAFYTHAKRRGKRWTSRIKVDGRVISLGYFHTAQEAHEAYGRAAVLHFGEFARAA